MAMTSNHLDAWISVLYVQSMVRKQVNRRLETEGRVSLESYDLLLTLEEAGDQGIDMSALADQLLLTQSGVSRMVERLVEKGLLDVRRSCTNHRFKLVSITPAGREERVAAWEAYQQVLVDNFASTLTDDQARSIVNGLKPLLKGKKLIGFRGDLG